MTALKQLDADPFPHRTAWDDVRKLALNLAGDGVTRDAISRGEVVLDPALLAPTDRIDAELRVLASEPKPIAVWAPARLHVGATEVGARIVPLAEDATPPHFALTWLGMGGDGHIASLFPNTDPQADDPLPVRRITPDPLPPEAPFDRLSLTIPALLDCDAVMFVLRGANKCALFEAALTGEHDLPVARLLNAASAPVTCFT